MKEAYIVDALRSPIGNFSGMLSHYRADDLLAHILKSLLERNPEIDPAKIDDVIIGCTNQAGEDSRNIARMALLLAGIPSIVPGETINRLCASGMSAVINAARAIKSGDGDLFVAGGVENMSRSPYIISKTSKPFGRDAQMYDSSIGWRFVNSKMKEMYGVDNMGITAENLAEIYKINRTDQDLFAFNSQRKASKARENGRFSLEITPVEIHNKKQPAVLLSEDEFIRPGTTIEILAGLKPAFKIDGSVTPGNSSGINDGAAALLVSSEKAIKNYGLNCLARIVSSSVVGVEPRVMGIGPVLAANKALKKASLKMSDMAIIEINEAFAVQVLACTRNWNLDDNDSRINPNGGGIALGHPLGMTGTRIIQTAAIELKKKNLKYALVSMCVGVGQGYAVILERC